MPEPNSVPAKAGDSNPQKPTEEAPKKNNTTTLIVVLVIIGVLVLISIGGCIAFRACANTVTKGIEEGIEEASGVDINTEDGEVSIKTKDGDYEAKTGELPKDFPTTLPIYDETTIISSSSYSGSQGTSFTVAMTTSDDYDVIVNFFKNELRNGEWTSANTTESSSGGSETTTFTFIETETPGLGWITVTSDEKETTIAYAITVTE